MLKKTVLGTLCVAMLASLAVAASDASLDGVKCLLVGKRDANPEKSAKWKDGQVYFCCDNCLGKFTKMDDAAKKEVASAANHQLVATKQYVQGGCPFSGGDVNPDHTLEIKGAKVGFCCENCLGKAKSMEEDEQIAKIFGEEAFKKAKFTLAKKEK